MKILKSAHWMGLTSVLALSLSGCKGTPQITRIEFVQDSALGGSLLLEGETHARALEARSGMQILELGQATKVGALKLSLFAETTQNLPQGMSARRAEIVSELDVDWAKEEGKVTAEIDESQVILSGTEQDEDELNCSNLFQFNSSEPGVLRIEFRGFESFASCSGEQIHKHDARLIGHRDVAKKDSGWFGNFYSKSEEVALGGEFVREFNAQNQQAILPQDHPTSQYVQKLADRLAISSDDPTLRPKVFVINADVLNAFALPGGYVYVFRGLLDATRSESELAGVMGHELAHVTARHGTKNMSEAQGKLITLLGAGILTQILVGAITDDELTNEIASYLPLAGYVGANLMILSDGRDNEYEADLLGSQYAWKAGFEPWGISDMFTVFKNLTGGSSGGGDDLFSTHPSHDNRINRVFDLSAFFYPAMQSYEHSTPAYQLAKDEMSRMPKLGDSVKIGLAFRESIRDFARAKVVGAVASDLKKKAGDESEKK